MVQWAMRVLHGDWDNRNPMESHGCWRVAMEMHLIRVQIPGTDCRVHVGMETTCVH